MKDQLKFQASVGDRHYVVCLSDEQSNRTFQVFDLHQNGSHYEYIYRNKSTGQYYLEENSKFDEGDLEVLSEIIESNLNTSL